MPKLSNTNKALAKFKSCGDGVRDYFWMLPEILENVSRPEPALAYCFQCIEAAQRVALYALLMRNYRTDSTLAWEAIDRLDITRSNFPEFYHALSGKKFAAGLRDSLLPAEAVRDRITHGKEARIAEVLKAIETCLSYAESLNERMYDDAGFRPFGQLRGVTSSPKPQLEKNITRLVLKGLGLDGGRKAVV